MALHNRSILGICPHLYQYIAQRSLQTTPTLCFYRVKNIRTGVPKTTQKKEKVLTYQQAQPPHKIGVSKAWDSWNTANLHEEEGASRTVTEDIFIRKFILGTFHRKWAGDVVIKRRYNMIHIVGLVKRGVKPSTIYFLVGYSEELLSHFLRCPVKLEIQTIEYDADLNFKVI